MSSKFFKDAVSWGIKQIPRSKKVSPTIRAFPPTKLSIKKSLEKTRGEEYLKRIRKLDKAQDKVKKGKEMIKEGQKTRKQMKDTGTAFQFRDKKSYHPIRPGDVQKFKIKKGVSDI
jgi:hypothetical protein